MEIPFTSLHLCLLTFALWLSYATAQYLSATRRPKGFPPGPPIRLGLGNIHQLTAQRPFLQFTEWSQTYGSILGLKIGPANVVILSDPTHIHELFCKRGAKYSARACGYIAMNHVLKEGRDKHFINLALGPTLRKYRTAAVGLFDTEGQKQARPIQEATASKLVQQLLDETLEEPLRQVKQWVLGSSLRAITGDRLEDRGTAYSDRFFLAQHMLIETMGFGASTVVELLPWLGWLPESLMDWKRKARIVRDYIVHEYPSYIPCARNEKRDDRENDTQRPASLMARVLMDNDTKEGDNRFTNQELAWLAGGLLEAAVDTTWATMQSFILFLVAHPTVQQQVYLEIHQVSPESPPNSSHLEKFPYLKACLLETLRIRPVLAVGPPRMVTEDDTFCGYTIPKGTTVIGNIWGIEHNPDDYENPEQFLPERFIRHPFGLKAGVSTQGRMETYGFGAGRRMCVGQKFAEASMMLAMSKMIWSYKMVAVEKLDIDVATGYNDGFVLSPKGFKIKFELRDEGKREAIIHDYEKYAEAVGDGKV